MGLEAQRSRVEEMAARRGDTLIAEFTEVESGRRKNRPQLTAALTQARKCKAGVVVAKLDRLSRDAELVLRLSREAEKNGMGGFLFCDLPDIDATTATGRMILSVMASVAEFEAGRVSERTKEALSAAKRRGQKLGAHLEPQAARNRERAANADTEAERVRVLVEPLRQQGMGLAAIAEALTASGVPTTGGGGKWHPNSVKRVLHRLQID